MESVLPQKEIEMPLTLETKGYEWLIN